MPERLRRIQQEGQHDDDQHQGVYVRGNPQLRAVEERQHGQRPDHAEDCGYFYDVLLGEVVSGVHFEDEHVVDA